MLKIAGPKLSKMQTVRKRELKRAMNLLHDEMKLTGGTGRGIDVYGLRLAISILGEMRNKINHEQAELDTRRTAERS